MSPNTDKTEEARSHLMAYAMGWLAEWSGAGAAALPPGLPAGSEEWLADYRALLGAGSRPAAGAPLLSIFSRVRRDTEPEPAPAYWPARPLSLESVAHPSGEDAARAQADPELWRKFLAEWNEISGWEPEVRFEALTHLLHKYAWAVPCSYGEPGVSLYDEFRALSALVHASDCEPEPKPSFLLVGGDIPGIQDFVYTITSKGAAKGLRGRSFFIQLLGDAVVRRLLAELKLPETNVIYAAGGNFMLLAQAGAEGTVSTLRNELDRGMLREFEGDMAFCLACKSLDATVVGSGAFADRASRALMEALGRQKRRRFADLAKKKWEPVFGPQGLGAGIFCSVCQHEQRPGEKGEWPEGGGWKCDQCAGFEQLAQTIARERLLLCIDEDPPAEGAKRWQKLLAELSGRSYDLGPGPGPHPVSGARAYAVNDVNFLQRQARGFRLIANTTPRAPDGTVRTFEELADNAQGLKRVGVLRMDVDDLGRVLTRWLPQRTMASTSAMSQALDRFFTGWLDAICRDVMGKPEMAGVKANRHDLLYVIYAGGDDLFVVGAWDLMPLLAERIAQQFALYTGRNPYLHISAGITLEDRKFPLYQAAKRAGEALDHGAKDLVRWIQEEESGAKAQDEEEKKGRKVEKNGISFLGQAAGWESYPFVRGLAEDLVRLTEEQNVPRSLLTLIRAIQARFGEDVQRARERGLPENKVYFGPWMWKKVYQLSRTARRYKDRKETEHVARAIERLETDVLTGKQMPYVGLATRWAEYLTRQEEG